MAHFDRPIDVEPTLQPDEVSTRSFPTAFRGFDPVQVRAFLGAVADELRRLRDVESELRRQVAEVGEATPEAPAPPTADDVPAIDGGEIVERARAEAEQLVRETRERVERLGAAATAEATRVLDEARVEAARLRATATDDLKGHFEEAEATAVRKIAEAEREAAAIRVTAREESEATIEAARDRGREMVAEAQAARERMLADLAKRKRAAQAQLDQLRAGRDRLLDTLKVARRSIDEMTTRFDANEGGTPPPSSGTPSGSVSTTPGVTSTEARPRAASVSTTPGDTGVAPERPRPVRTRAVAIGEAPLSAARPQIAAPLAQAATDADPGPGPVVASVPAETPAPQPAPAPVRSEERRSSALRILRRGKAPEAAAPRPPLVGRDSSSEGVRIIGRPAAEVARDPHPEPEPEVAAMEAIEPESPSEPEPEPASASESESEVQAERPQEPEHAEVEPVVDASADREPPAADQQQPVFDAPDAPLTQEEIRPRIEDLFARIRADREAATASARDVLAAAEQPVVSSPPALVPAQAELAAAKEARPAEADRPVATSDEDEDLMQRRDAVTEPLIGQLTKRLKRALQDEQNASLDRLRTSRGVATIDQVLSRPDDQALPYRHLAGPFLDQVARASASASPHGATAVSTDDLAAQLADDLAGAVRARLQVVLTTAASDEVELGAVSERISGVYRDWKVQKVERLATHYVIAAHERGGFLAQPEGALLRWLVDDEGPCPDCEDNALAGPTPRGEPFPTGQLHPPAHLGCRCLLVASPA